MATEAIRRCPCNVCGGETDHDSMSIGSFAEKDLNGEDVTRLVHAVTCRGCKSVALRDDKIKKTADGELTIDTRYTPPRLLLQPPNWVRDLEVVDNKLHGLLIELYSAAHEGQQRLVAMAVRAAVDHVMTRELGDIGGFERKLETMVEQEHISEKQKEMLEVVIDAASATQHRGYRPPFDLLRQMVNVMEYMIYQYYIAGPMLKVLKIQIPPRPPRGVKTGAS